MSAPRYAVYWQPGCSSCLQAKEFLARHGIEFDSINVLATDGAYATLAALGARSVPVIARGTEWTYGQDLDAVARFIGAVRNAERLSITTLTQRLDLLLDLAERCSEVLPEAMLETPLPGRADRTRLDLAFHVPMIVVGFLAAARGERLEFEHFTRRPQGAERSRMRVLALQRATRVDLAAFAAAPAARESVDTYYGEQPLAAVLERTAWHVAQHCRQLEWLVREAGAALVPPLSARELAGLPLPEGIWDRELGTPA